jgi:Zn-finger nucleic acid-binding protein
VWLDRGELDKIIERGGREAAAAAPPQSASQQPAQQPRSQYDRDHDDGYKRSHGHYPKRKKSFFEELFD